MSMSSGFFVFKVGRWAIKIVPHDRMIEVWSSKKIPGAEARTKPGIRTYLKASHSFADKARPFSIWRPDLKVLGFHLVGRCGKLKELQSSQAGAAAGGNTFQQGLRTSFSALSFIMGG